VGPTQQTTLDVTPSVRVQVLAEALPYIQRFVGKIIVIKYGGAAMTQPEFRTEVLRDIVFLASLGIKPVVVHGGGPEINHWLDRLEIPTKFVSGLRVTDSSTMEVVEMVLAGRVNKQLVELINLNGGHGVGLCGHDGPILRARPYVSTQAQPDIGFVGDIAKVDPRLLLSLLKEGYIPVLATVASDEMGQTYNINADTVAGEVAAALQAEKLILLTDTPGLLRSKDDPDSLIARADLQSARELIEDGIVSGGMIPKLQCCIRAIAQGVKAAHILDGRLPHSLLLEICTDSGIGTMIVSSR
jgi:acetylglutamate kinase